MTLDVCWDHFVFPAFPKGTRWIVYCLVPFQSSTNTTENSRYGVRSYPLLNACDKLDLKHPGSGSHRHRHTFGYDKFCSIMYTYHLCNNNTDNNNNDKQNLKLHHRYRVVSPSPHISAPSTLQSAGPSDLLLSTTAQPDGVCVCGMVKLPSTLKAGLGASRMRSKSSCLQHYRESLMRLPAGQ